MTDYSLVQFKLMLPASLKARVEDEAKANRRSLSQEIVAALEDAYPAAPDDLIAEYDAIGVQMVETLGRLLNGPLTDEDRAAAKASIDDLKARHDMLGRLLEEHYREREIDSAADRYRRD